MDDLSVQVEDNQLVVRGRQTDDKSRLYLHRGIAARQFQRSFVLAEGLEVLGANLDNGLLNIDLRRPPPEPKVRRIRIEPARPEAGGGHPQPIAVIPEGRGGRRKPDGDPPGV